MKPRIKIGAVFICIGLFFFFLLLRFPYGNLRGKIFGEIYNRTHIAINAQDIYPALFGWPGVGIKQVDVTIPLSGTYPLVGQEMNLSSQKMVFRVGLASLFPLVPSVSLYLENLKKGGDLFFKVGSRGGVSKVYWETTKLGLEQLSPPGDADPLTGILTSEGDLDVDQKEFSKTTGQMTLNLDNFNVPSQQIRLSEAYAFLIPALKIGKLSGKIVVKNGSAEFNNFQFGANESDLKGTITGDVRLGKDYTQSFVNLILKFQLSAKILNNPQAETFLNFFKTYQTATAGDYALKWSASIQDLNNLSINAFPQPIK